MSWSLMHTKEIDDALKEVLKLDNMAMDQLKDYADREVSTPQWARVEVERAFRLGYLIAKKKYDK